MFKDSLSNPAQQQLKEEIAGANKVNQNQMNHNSGANDEVDDLTNNPVVEISREIFRLESDIRKLTIRVDKRLITKNIQDSLQSFRKNFDLYFESFKTPGNIDAIVTAGANTATYGESVGHILNRFSSLGFENRRLAQQIIQKSRAINNSLATQRETFIRGLSDYSEADLPQFDQKSESPAKGATPSALRRGTDFSQQVAAQAAAKPAQTPAQSVFKQPRPSVHGNDPISRGLRKAEQTQKSTTQRKEPSAREKELNELLKKSRRQIQNFMENAKKAETVYARKLKKIQALYDEATEQLKASRFEIEQLKTQLSGTDIARNFEQCAEAERSNADFYRYATFAYLGVFFLLISYLFFETTTVGFDVIKTSVRTFLTLCILIPCAYIAKESSAHRKQEHRYMRMALEIRAFGAKARITELVSNESQKKSS